MPVSHSSDASPEESANYVTVIRPKTSPHPYSSTIYNKSVRNNVLHLAANVNSLGTEKKPHWIQSLLQKEITYQPEAQSTTPQVFAAYSPKIFEPQPSTNVNVNVQGPTKLSGIENSFAEPTTAASMVMSTESIFSHYKQPVLPIRVPMSYVIFQGHSKVKTYGADYNQKKPEKHEPVVVPIAVKEDIVVKNIVATDSHGNELQVKHLHKIHTPETKPKMVSTKPTKKPANSAMDSLLSLLDSSFASFGLSNMESKSKTNVAKTSADTTKTISTINGPTTIRPDVDS